MDTNQPSPRAFRFVRTAAAARALAMLGLLAHLLGVVAPPMSTPESPLRARPVLMSVSRVSPARPVLGASSTGPGRPVPDATAEYVGGIAARLYVDDGTAVPGNVFLLMAIEGSDASATLFDETPLVHDNGVAPETRDSNVVALETVEDITGVEIEMREFTSASGGGASGGVAYTVAYLNILSGGAFTGDLRIAATGRIGRNGYFDSIDAIHEKTAAARFAGVDVLFTASAPSHDAVERNGVRHVGVRFRARHTGDPLAEERLLGDYQAWGADQPDGMDIVQVRHIADVASYLCGAGSAFACQITELLADTTTGSTAGPATPSDRSELLRPTGVR